jgi:hypothetical protein
MSINGKKTVWVLGAGFSRSLGGPLLADLFGPVPEADDLAYFPRESCGDLARDLCVTRQVFKHGLNQKCWANAEEFLAKVDEAFDERGRSWNILRRVVQESHSHLTQRPADYLEDIQRTVRRTLAAESMRFALDPNLEDERWLPYREWARTLEPGLDTIVTFNYDTALECISEREQGRMLTALPTTVEEVATRGRVPIYHLHGCAEWVVEGLAVTHVCIEEALGGGREIAIGVPGPNKAGFAETRARPLWHAAEDALANADNIAFVGYSFPRTDAMAHIRLLKAIRRDQSTEARRYAHLVLGRDIHSDDQGRMVALIESCHGPRRRFVMHPGSTPTNAFVIRQHPLGAEDFLAHYSDILAP